MGISKHKEVFSMNIFESIHNLLAKGEDLVLATIFSHSGSTPRTTGARMVIRGDGSIIGTIGGGKLEANTMAMAPEIFEKKITTLREFRLTGKDASAMDMICGGNVSVLMEYLNPKNDDQLEILEAIIDASTKHIKAWLLTELPTQVKPDTLELERCVLRRDGLSVGKLCVDIQPGKGSPIGLFEEGIAHETEGIDISSTHYPVQINIGERKILVEPLGSAGSVIIFGGGHISQSMAPLVQSVGFRTIIVDDREEFANSERFPEVEQLVLTQSFENCFRELDVDQDSYIVIVTRGHLHDSSVLSQALKTNAAYIGMIGSERKKEMVFKELIENEGFKTEDMQRVYSPIGVEIGAETPEEIAISIVAELVKVRAGHK
jgi:xanthine dehydrogenase accessory factor